MAGPTGPVPPSLGYCTAGVDNKRVYAVWTYTTADSAVSYLNHAQIA